MLLTASLFLVLVALLCLKIKWSHGHWSRLGVPTPKIHFPWGNHSLASADVLLGIRHTSEVLKDHYLEMYGRPFYGTYILTKPMLVVCDPTIIKQVMVKDFEYFTDRFEQMIQTIFSGSTPTDTSCRNQLLLLTGQEWKDTRAPMTRIFTGIKIRGMVGTIHQVVRQMLLKIDKSAGKLFCMKDLSERVILDIFAVVAFGLDAKALADQDSQFVKVAGSIGHISYLDAVKAIMTFVPGGLSLLNLSKVSVFKPVEMDFLYTVLKSAIRDRMQSKCKHNDFIDLFIEAMEDDSNNFDETKAVAASVLMLVAGNETTSMALTSTCYELAMNPDVQKKLQHTIDTMVLESGHDLLDFDQVSSMEYMDQVLMESIRLHPVVTGLPRACTKSYTLPGSNIRLEKGEGIYFNVAGVHMDPKYYPNPEKFDPDRFSQENKLKRDRYTFLGFGHGPRNCIGTRLALIMMKIIISSILAKYDIVRTKETPDKLVLEPTVILGIVKDGVWIKFEPRKGH